MNRFRTTVWLLAMLLCRSTALPALANTGALEGRVVDRAAGTPIEGAEVSVIGYPGSARTSRDGTFTLTVDPRPPFVMVVILPGGRVAKPIEILKPGPGPLELRIEAAVTEEVTVTAGVAPSIEATLGSAMTMVSRNDLVQRGVANLMHAVENVPGVSQVSEGQAAVPALRGLARGRTLVLIDGSRVSSERRVGPSATFMDPAIVEGVDVARGPGSVAYGSDAFGGVISVRTRRPGFQGLTADASVTVGSGIPDRRVDFAVSKGFGSSGLIAGGHVRASGDYDGPDAPVLNSGWADRGAFARYEHRTVLGLLGFSWQGDFGRDVGRPRNNSNAVRFYYPFENSHRLNASLERVNAGHLDLIRVSGFIGTYEQRTDQDRIPTAARPRDIVRADVSARDFEARATAQKQLRTTRIEFGADVNGRAGVEAHDVLIQYDLSGAVTSRGDTVSIESARRVDAAGFVEIDTAVASRMTISGGVRGDRVTSVNRGGHFGDRSIADGAAAGYAAVAIGPLDKFTFTAQLARGFRVPTLSDRFFRGPNARGFITGNPGLEPETSLQLDLGARYSSGRFSAAAYVYHYRIDELVERFSPATDFFEFRNRGRARIRGLEAEAQAELGQGFSIQLAAQIAGGRALDDGADLDDISPAQFSVQLRKRAGSKASAFVSFAYWADDDRPGPSEVAAPGHANLDAGATWTVHRRVELRGAVRNILDASYYASPDPRFVPAPGRNAFVTARVRF